LRTLLIGVTLLAPVGGWIVGQEQIVLQRRSSLKRVQDTGAVFWIAPFTVVIGPRPGLIRSLLGDKVIMSIALPKESTSDAEFERIKAAFPETAVIMLSSNELKSAQGFWPPE
jgi:hypothetical protein